VDSKETVVNDELLVKFLHGEASPEEADAVAGWLELEQNAAHLDDLERAWNAARPSATPRMVNKQAGWAKVAAALEDQSVVKVVSINRFALAWKIAAAVVVVAAGVVLYQKFSAVPDKVMATQQNSERLQLADQSVAVLYHETVIRYPEKFGRNTREVAMEKGEAFFTIAPDKEHPFIIHTPTGEVRVVGTAFNLSVKEGQLEVGVSEGKVMVYTATDTAYVVAGVTARVQAKIIQVNKAVKANDWAYATRKLTFNDTPMEEVIQILEKTYQQPVNVSNNQIKRCSLNGKFDNVSLEKLLTFVAESLNLSLTKNDNGFILQGEGCP
jgi:transmembrane sensor